MSLTSTDVDTILVVDFGAQYAQLIARRVREANVYSEIVPRDMPIGEMLARRPKGIIFSGGPSSVHVEGAPSIDPSIYDAGVPLLGICYGCQLIAQQLGGEVRRTGTGEYGRTPLNVVDSSLLFADLPAEQEVWMSHGDSIVLAPAGFKTTASSAAPVAALEDAERAIYGVQFHPEVIHTPAGHGDPQSLPVRRLRRPAHLDAGVDHRAGGGSRSRPRSATGAVICGLSGGVDSAVAAALVHKAVGDQLTCVFVDTGLLRSGEAAQVEETFLRQFHVDLVHVKAADRFLSVLAGVTDPEQKRKAIGETFIRVFEEAAKELGPKSQ